MNLVKIMISVLSIFLFLHWSCNSNPGKLFHLDVPFHSQKAHNYCGIACIQMWSEFDFKGPTETQQQIANRLGVGANYVDPNVIWTGVSWYTGSPGYIATKSYFEKGGQGDLISSVVTGINESTPSIIPIHLDHVVLAIGAEWMEKKVIVGMYYEFIPVAKVIRVHEPRGIPNKNYSIGELLGDFTAWGGRYWVLLGRESFLVEGEQGHDEFVMRRGNYYGGPSHYDPKDLYPDPLPVK
ncbi:MAG: hypothetical protein GY765_43690 [bacterium]|nr:hypothetical protein [bacterium]